MRHSNGAQMRIECDGEVILNLRDGERKEVALDPGPHTIRARMDWISSESVLIAVAPDAKSTLTFQLSRLGLLLRTFYRPRTAIGVVLQSERRHVPASFENPN